MCSRRPTYDPDSFPVGSYINHFGKAVQITGVRHERQQRSIMWNGLHVWLEVVNLKAAPTN